MHIKQISLIIATFLFAIATGVGLIALGPVTESVSAYKCQGTPDDYYSEAPGAFGGSLAKLNSGGKNFRWDNALGRCVVDVNVQEGSYRNQNNDGSPRQCAANETLAKISGEWRCYPVKTYSTNDKPVNDDGSPIDPAQIYCGGNQDNYDEESFTCKESGACNLAGTCDYNKVGLNADPTTDCVGSGGIYKKGGDPSCTFSTDSCKTKDLKLKADKSGCEELNECDKKYGANTNSPEYKKCEEARNNPNKDCDNEPTPEMKEACEAGAAAAPESYDGCGEARTVLIKCSEDARGLPVLAGVLKIFINVLSVIIGIASVGGLAYASILYAKAEDNSSNVSEARTLIRNIVIGILLYGFLVAIVNWLVPGGIIG